MTEPVEHGQAGAEAPNAWGRALGRLRRRRSFRLALAVLALLGALAVYAPLVASDRPYRLVALHRGDYERARKSLVPVTQALKGLLERSETQYLAARPVDSTQSYPQALAAERAALATRLGTLARNLEPARARGLDDTLRAADDLIALALVGAKDRLESGAEELLRRVTELGGALDAAKVPLLPVRSYPLFVALTPLEVGLQITWLWVLTWPLWRRWLRGSRGLALALLAGGVAALVWSTTIGGGSAFDTSPLKEQISKGELAVESVLFPPIPYGFAEQRPEESLRPPTWLAAAELDDQGAYVRGARRPARDVVTGFLPRTRAIEIRAGEPPLNSPWRHWLGTDGTGRDLAARLVHGARASLAVGCLATLLLLAIGVLVGALAGTFGGVVDLLVSRVIEVVVSFPLLFLVLVAVAFVGPSIWNVILVLGCVGWTGVARLARSEFLRQRELEYVLAARSFGFSRARIAFRHILPNALAPLLVAGTFSVASAILIESALSFLGYGVRVPIPSWGALTSESLDVAYWWLQVFPGLFLFVTVLCVQLVGDALRDAWDPKMDERMDEKRRAGMGQETGQDATQPMRDPMRELGGKAEPPA